MSILLHDLGADLPSPISDDVTLEDLELDSLDLAELKVGIETLYELTLEDEEQDIRPDAPVNELVGRVYMLISAGTVQ